MSEELTSHHSYHSIEIIYKVYSLVNSNTYLESQLSKYFSDIINANTFISNILRLLESLGYIDKDEKGYYYALKPRIDYTKFRMKFLKDVLRYVSQDERSFLNPNNFFFENEYLYIELKNKHYKYYALRNLLIYEKIIKNKSYQTYKVNNLYVSVFEQVLRGRKSQKTIEKLKEELERLEIIGMEAEEFVLEYEKKKFRNKDIQYVAPFNVNAGYDIKSYINNQSEELDKFIEVKCITNQRRFFWSNNEIKVAKDKGQSYFLYLVSDTFDKEPIQIQNPYKQIFQNNDISYKVQSYEYDYEEVIKSIKINS